MPPVPPGLPGLGRNKLDPDAWLGFIQSHDILADSYYTTGMYCPAFNPSDGYTSITSRVEVEGDPDERVSVTCLGCAEEPMIQEVRPGEVWLIELGPEAISNAIIAEIRYDLPGWGSAVFYDVPISPGSATVLPTLLLQPSPEPSEWPFRLISSIPEIGSIYGVEVPPGTFECDIPPASSK